MINIKRILIRITINSLFQTKVTIELKSSRLYKEMYHKTDRISNINS